MQEVLKRVSEIWNIAKSLEAKLMSDWMIPVPDEKIEIKVNGATVYYQWIAWKDVLNKLNMWYRSKDPLDWVWYTYTTTNNLRRYQVFWYLEKEMKNLIYKMTQIMSYSWSRKLKSHTL